MGKVLKALIIIVAAFLVIFLVFMGVTAYLMKASRGDRQEVLSSNSSGQKEALVVYQPSLSSIAGDVAHNIAKGLNDSGYRVTMNHPGKHMPSDLSEYSIVVFGAPVYAGQVPSPLADYIKRVSNYSGARIILFSTGSTEEKPELDTIAGLLKEAKPYKSEKFIASDKDIALARAYNLGVEAAKE